MVSSRRALVSGALEWSSSRFGEDAPLVALHVLCGVLHVHVHWHHNAMLLACKQPMAEGCMALGERTNGGSRGA